MSYAKNIVNVFYHVHGNQNSQHSENNKKMLETRKQDGSCQKIQGSKEREIKLIDNDESDE